MLDNLKKVTRSKTFWWNLFILVLFLVSVLLRFLAIDDKAVHYHANFQIYVHGEVWPFHEGNYYEEYNICSSDFVKLPSSRVHLHDQEAHLIHVHAPAVTYNHFLNNIGIHLGNSTLEIDGKVYVDGSNNQLRFILNGREVTNLNNRVIESLDVLLIDYSNDNLDTLIERYNAIPQDAEAANLIQDPQTCAGDGEPTEFWQRLRKSLGL